MEKEKIDRFINEFAFLSNFWISTLKFDGIFWKSAEHAYQAAKTLISEEKEQIKNAETPALAKKLGRIITIREDWNDVKVSIMTEIVREKFKNPILRELLIATDNAELIEGNFWNDKFWGVCRGVGENNLGKILMQIRDEIRNEV